MYAYVRVVPLSRWQRGFESRWGHHIFQWLNVRSLAFAAVVRKLYGKGGAECGVILPASSGQGRCPQDEFRGPFRPKSVDGRLLLDALQTFGATMSALPRIAD